MATARHNGQLVILNLNGTPIAHSQNSTLSLSQTLMDTTTKDSSNWTEHLRGDRSCTITVEGLTDYSASFGADELADMIVSAQSANFSFASTTSTDTKYTGTVNLESLELTEPNNEAAGYSGSLVVTGAVTKGTVA